MTKPYSPPRKAQINVPQKMYWYSWLLLAIPTLLLLWMGICLLGVLPIPTAEQQAALAAMRQARPDPNDDTNAYASLWLIDYPVPLSERRGLLQQDVERAEDLVNDEESLENFRPAIASKLTKELIEKVDIEKLCSRNDADCLAKIRRNADTIRSTIDSHAGLLTRTRELSKFDQIRDPLPKTFDSPIPPIGSGELVISDAALHFVQGDTHRGFSEICEFANTWRRLRSHTDLLLYDAIGISRITESARVFLQMLGEVPSSYVLPETCSSTFLPLADNELDQCNEMRNDFRAMELYYSDARDYVVPKSHRAW